MIELAGLTFKNHRNEQWVFNTDDCPLHSFAPEGGTRMTDRPRMQQHGDWPGFNYLDHMILRIEGDLLRDTTADLIAARIQLLEVLHPKAGKQNIRDWGRLEVKFEGFGLLHNTVTGDTYVAMPMTAQAPNTVQPYQIAWKVYDPFWTDNSGNRFLI